MVFQISNTLSNLISISSMARYTRRLTPIVGDERRRKRACHDRTQTVMKKGDELAVLCPGTKVWVIVQNGEQTCMYSSEEASSPPVFSASDVRRFPFLLSCIILVR